METRGGIKLQAAGASGKLRLTNGEIFGCNWRYYFTALPCRLLLEWNKLPNFVNCTFFLFLFFLLSRWQIKHSIPPSCLRIKQENAACSRPTDPSCKQPACLCPETTKSAHQNLRTLTLLCGIRKLKLHLCCDSGPDHGVLLYYALQCLRHYWYTKQWQECCVIIN